MRVLLAGGGSAGHTSPLLATADALQRLASGRRDHLPRHPRADRGPDHPGRRLPARVRAERPAAAPAQRRPRPPARPAARGPPGRARRRRPDPSRRGRGFGGFVSVPAYLAARKRKVPLVVHEGNTLPGVANKLGARFTDHVATSFPDTPLRHATYVGLPIRRMISTLDRAALRAEARATFGLRDDLPVLLVTGGSQGAPRSTGRCSARPRRSPPPASRCSTSPARPTRRRRPTPACPTSCVGFVDRMDLAYSAADAVLCRSGSNTRDRGVRGRAAGDLRAAADRQRRAGAQRPRRRSTPAAGCWSTTPLTPTGSRRTPCRC